MHPLKPVSLLVLPAACSGEVSAPAQPDAAGAEAARPDNQSEGSVAGASFGSQAEAAVAAQAAKRSGKDPPLPVELAEPDELVIGTEGFAPEPMDDTRGFAPEPMVPEPFNPIPESSPSPAN